MKNVLVLDAGNSIIKSKTQFGEVAYPHAMLELTETEYQNVLTRAGRLPLIDYLRVNGRPYVIGESAERHGTVTRRTGAARYTADYYGIFVAATLARFYEVDTTVSLFGSHPPGDVDFQEDLMRAAIGTWTVEVGDKTTTFRVEYANTFDEPRGGLMNILLTEDGQHYQRSDIKEGRTLVIDIGGHTTDWLAANPGGEVDPSLNESTSIGILEVIRDFERSFRANNKEIAKLTGTLPPDRVRDAIRTGVFQGGGRDIPCHKEVQEATSALINRIANTYQSVAGGALPYDNIVLTGGGSAMLFDRLLPALGHQRVFLADTSESIHMANVRGGLKLWKLLLAHDLLPN